MRRKAVELKTRYESIALSLDHKTTACDYNLRELEIKTAAEYMHDGCKILDVGCGLGYAVIKYASLFKIEACGIDYASNMIKGARKLLKQNRVSLLGTVSFQKASVLKLPYEKNYFDVVTSSRCLMALLDWNLQKKAIEEVHRVLKPGGIFVLMEGTFEGLTKLNKTRKMFGLEEISADTSRRLCTLKFKENDLLAFCKPFFIIENIQRFGMYYFLTRVVHPLLVAPGEPRYDHRINEIALQIARIYPDFEGLGHLVAFILIKRR